MRCAEAKARRRRGGVLRGSAQVPPMARRSLVRRSVARGGVGRGAMGERRPGERGETRGEARREARDEARRAMFFARRKERVLDAGRLLAMRGEVWGRREGSRSEAGRAAGESGRGEARRPDPAIRVGTSRIGVASKSKPQQQSTFSASTRERPLPAHVRPATNFGPSMNDHHIPPGRTQVARVAHGRSRC